MLISIEIPEIEGFETGFPLYWIHGYAQGNIFENLHIKALSTTYIRLVELGLKEYRLGKVPLEQFWHPSTSFDVRALHDAIAHFEICITTMHRAIVSTRQSRLDCRALQMRIIVRGSSDAGRAR
jgi:hypothetical protein